MPGETYEALYRISQLFNSILDPDLLFEQVMDEALKTMNAERGLVILIDEKTGAQEVRVARHIERELAKELSAVSQTALKEVLDKREARVYLDAPGAFPAARSVIIGQVRSIAIAPLLTRGRLIGAIYLDSRTDRNVFHDDILPFVKSFASIAALAIENARLYQGLSEESSRLRAVLGQWRQFPEIIGRSRVMQAVYELMNRVIPTDAPVIISGETGTGKELVARAIHYNGPRKNQPFVPVNCGAIPENLLESELFGYRKGAFTGAVTDRKGLFEAANGGTIFLDEVADLPLSLQPKLLRVLQSGEIRWVGDTQTFKVDIRVISATNKNLPAEVKAGEFRDDLFYRLNVIPLDLPPLRQRRDDIPLLVNRFLAASADRLGKQISGISQAALARLIEYSWPGNVRQLENVVERAAVLCPGPKVSEADIMLTQPEPGVLPDNAPVAEIEKRAVLERLKQFNGNRTRAAASLGISRRTLLNKLAEWKADEEHGEIRDS
jgi:Nif-specific regulatory protein